MGVVRLARGAVAAVAMLVALYVLPFALLLAGSLAGPTGYLCGVAGRAVTARATGGRWFPDALAHPASIAAFAVLVAISFRRRRQGRLAWKGWPVESSSPPSGSGSSR